MLTSFRRLTRPGAAVDDFTVPRIKQAVDGAVGKFRLRSGRACRRPVSEIASGIVEFPVQTRSRRQAGWRSRAFSRRGSLFDSKRQEELLPLEPGRVRSDRPSLATRGPRSDFRGGSAQVDHRGTRNLNWQSQVWFPTSPLASHSREAANSGWLDLERIRNMRGIDK